jgi:hypothetical protein
VPYHVEIGRSISRRAREFNLSEEKLRRTVLDPWLRSSPIQLGDREWDPRKCTLKILEGPRLSLAELGVGQGWSNAERSGKDVTAALLDGAGGGTALGSVAVLAETLSAQLSVTAMLEQLGLRPVEWAQARSRIVAAAREGGEGAATAGVDAALLLIEDAPPSGTWLFEAGLAIGALGGKVIVAQFGSEPPPSELARFEVIRLAPDQRSALAVLADALGRSGWELRRPPGEPA